MFSTSIPCVLFALLIILQPLTTVLALPTSTPATSTSSQLEIRQSSESSRNSNGNGGDRNNGADGNNVTTSNKVTPAQIAGVVIGALCLIALGLIFSYCFVQHQRRKRELRAANEKTAAIERTKRVNPSFEYAG